jgi:hypothetical protein
MLHEMMGMAPLPIMLCDQRKLTPSFGYVFDPRWLDLHDSLLSILWKFIKMNSVSGHLIVMQLAKTDVDPYEGIAVCKFEIDMQRLHVDLGLSLKVIRESITPNLLGNATCPNFRFCRRCLNRGYHGTAYQFESVIRCPLHGDILETRCRSCGMSTAYHLNVSILNSPFRCKYCSNLYGTNTPNFIHKSTFKRISRRAITRTRILRC